jgi:hypothetical protein
MPAVKTMLHPKLPAVFRAPRSDVYEGGARERSHESLVIGKNGDTVNSRDPYVELLHQDAEVADGNSVQVYHDHSRRD